MRFRAALIAFVGLLVTFGTWAAEVTVDKDRMLVVDGKRTFVLGLYENPADDAVLQAVAKAGFNLVQSNPDATALDRLSSNGLYAWINVGSSIDLSQDEAACTAQLRKTAETFATHPALLCWEVPDEALWNVWYSASQWFSAEKRQQSDLIAALTDQSQAAELRSMREKASKLFSNGKYAEAEGLADEIWRRLGKEQPHPDWKLSTAPERMARLAEGMTAGYSALKQLDPKHPIWMNHAPRNSVEQLTLFGKAADVAGCDIYPVPWKLSGHSDLREVTMASVGAYTERMQDSIPGKPVWMVLQGFGWSDLGETAKDSQRDQLVRPTYEQSRFMAYDAIVHGARGILYWGTAYIDRAAPFWTELLQVVSELKGLSDVLTAPEPTLDLKASYAQTYSSMDRGVAILPKDVQGRLWLIVANEGFEPLTYTIAGLGKYEGAVYKDTASDESAKVEQGRMTLTIPGYGVHVLAPQ